LEQKTDPDFIAGEKQKREEIGKPDEGVGSEHIEVNSS